MEMDWGATAALWAAWDRSIDCLYVYTEHCRDMAEPTINVAAIKARGDWVPGATNPMSRGRRKEDGDRLIEEYRALGLWLTPTRHTQEGGIKAVEERFSTSRIKIFRTCENLQAEYRLYRRDEDGKIVREFDRLLDCLQYIVSMYRGIARTQPVDDRARFAALTRGDPTVGY
jgi:hypothetical protein